MGSSVNLNDIAIHLNHDDALSHREAVADLLGRNQLHFPGAQPVSFARHHIDELRRRDYFMCEKTDGIRCLLYLTVDFHDGEEVEAQFLIDRKNDYYYIRRDDLHIPGPNDIASYHTGTLLDGELVRDRLKNGEEKLVYLIFDCLAIDRENVMGKPFDKRLARIHDNIVKPLREFAKRYPDDVKAQPFQIEMKAMQLGYAMEMMFKDVIPKLPHGNDGLIFTCKSTAYVAGTDEHILKWKPPHENTIDFRLLLGEFPKREDEDGQYDDWDAKPEMELFVNGREGAKGYESYADLKVTEQEWEAMKNLNQQLDGRIIECYMEASTGSWRPKLESDGSPRFRDDKKDANHVSVVQSVMESIQDAVSEQDLIAAAASIRTATKKRLAVAQEEEKRLAAEWKRKRLAEDAKKAEAAKRAEDAKQSDRGSVEADDGPGYED